MVAINATASKGASGSQTVKGSAIVATIALVVGIVIGVVIAKFVREWRSPSISIERDGLYGVVMEGVPKAGRGDVHYCGSSSDKLVQDSYHWDLSDDKMEADIGTWLGEVRKWCKDHTDFSRDLSINDGRIRSLVVMYEVKGIPGLLLCIGKPESDGKGLIGTVVACEAAPQQYR